MATGAAEGELFVGDKAKDLRGILKLSYPMKHGVIHDWEDMHAVWQHMYHELNIVQDQHPVLLTEAPLNPKANRGKAAEIFFETFNVPALYVQVQAILSLSVSHANKRNSLAECNHM
jgi:centractin